MRRHLVFAILSCALFACSSPPDKLGTVLEFEKYKNEGDLESALELFAAEPSLHFGSLGTITGLTNVRHIFEYDLALNTCLRFQDCTEDGLEVSCRVVETNDWLRTVNIDSVTYDENRFTFTTDGRIETINAELSAESGQALGSVMAEFHEWAMTHKPLEYGDLFSDEGRFVYSQNNAENVLALLRIWRSE